MSDEIKEFKALEEVTIAEGSGHVVFSDKVDKPIIIITGYYETIRCGTLDEFIVLIPKKTKVYIKRRWNGAVYYLPELGLMVKWRRGDADTPDKAEILEMTEDDYKEIEKLKELEKLIDC